MAKPDWGALQQRFLSDHAKTSISPSDWCEAQGLNYATARRYIKKPSAQSAQKNAQKKVRTAQIEKCADELVGSELTSQQKRFVTEYLVDHNATAAAERAGYSSPHYGRELLAKPVVAEAIAQQQKASLSRTLASADEVLAQMWELATFDANQISQYRRGSCRYCWGLGHQYQWRDMVEFEEERLKGRTGNVPKPVGLTATNDVVFGINISWGFPADAGDTLNTEIQYSMTADGASPMLLADVPYPQKLYQQMGLKAGQEFWYRARLIDRIGNQGEWTEFVGGQASIDVTDITEAVLNQIKDTDLFKDLIESAVDSNQKVADMASAITENADKLAAAVGANKQTAESIIHNALAIANVVVSQSAQNGANSAKFEQLREVIATETEARVTDVTRLEAKVSGNEAGITEVRQTLATETEARATAVDELTAKTGDNAAGVTLLTQAVTTLDSSTTSRFEELSGKTDKASGGIQNTSIALIENTLAQVNQSVRMSVQYGDSKAGIQRVDTVMADASKAVAESLKTLDSSAAGGSSNVTDFSKTMADFSQVAATRINSLSVSMNGQTAAITELYNAQIDTSGKLNAMYNIKVAVDSNGRQYAAGMGIGVENTPGGMQSQVLFLADRFAVMTQAGGTVTLPFVIQNGQTIIRDTVIGDASITRAKLAETISSVNYSPGQAGLSINFKTGTLENYGGDSSGAMKQTNNTISIKDANRLRVQIGRLTGVF